MRFDTRAGGLTALSEPCGGNREHHDVQSDSNTPLSAEYAYNYAQSPKKNLWTLPDMLSPQFRLRISKESVVLNITLLMLDLLDPCLSHGQFDLIHGNKVLV